jgi:hypothetical protein
MIHRMWVLGLLGLDPYTVQLLTRAQNEGLIAPAPNLEWAGQVY